MSSFTTPELLAAWTSRQFQDDDRVFVGAGLTVPRAGALLAHLTHAPNMKLSMGLASVNVPGQGRLPSTKYSTDFRIARWAEAMVIHNDIFDRPQFAADVFFVGGIQIDRYGNTNLSGLRGRDTPFAVRGPGPLGTTSMAHYARRYYIYAARHDPATFVEKVDYITVFGHGDGGDHRARLQLDQFNPGPRKVITPLAILDFETEDHRMRLDSVHPGVTVDAVADATGFELVIEEPVPTTASPTPGELHILRDRGALDEPT